MTQRAQNMLSKSFNHIIFSSTLDFNFLDLDYFCFVVALMLPLMNLLVFHVKLVKEHIQISLGYKQFTRLACTELGYTVKTCLILATH